MEITSKLGDNKARIMSQVKTSWVWKYFEAKSKSIAKCNLCQKDIARSHFGTSSMASHLKSQHRLDDPDKPTQVGASTATTPKVPVPKLMPPPGSMMGKFVQRASLAEILAKCAAGDGFSINGTTNSSALKEYVHMKGYQMPKSSNTVFNLVLSFADVLKGKVKQQIAEKMAKNVKFSIALDEWTDITNKRYLVLALTDSEETYRLGLIALPGLWHT